jgi:CheY-like chemotaxis protein
MNDMSESGIFKAAVALPAHERAAFLDQACGAEQELRREVESLLAAHDALGSFLQDSALPSPATAANWERNRDECPIAKQSQEQLRTPQARRAVGHGILVADDNRDSAGSLGTLLQMMEHEVCTVHDGLVAVAAAAEFRPNIVLLDIGMPRLNGYDAARRIREDWGKNLVLVALTGWGQEQDRQRSHEAGFDFHIVKPVEPIMLEELLAKLPVTV